MGINDDRDNSTIDFNRALDFCVWALQKDGMHVPPFDRHEGGDASLRALGLDPPSWETWVRAVAAAAERRVAYERRVADQQQATADHYGRVLEEYAHRVRLEAFGSLKVLAKVGTLLGGALLEHNGEPEVPPPDAASLWTGHPAIGERLDWMFQHYKQHRRAPRRRYWKTQRVREYLISPRFQRFQAEVTSRWETAPRPVLVCFVNYPGPVIYPVTETTVMIGVKEWDADPDEFERTVDEALDLLRAP